MYVCSSSPSPCSVFLFSRAIQLTRCSSRVSFPSFPFVRAQVSVPSPSSALTTPNHRDPTSPLKHLAHKAFPSLRPVRAQDFEERALQARKDDARRGRVLRCAEEVNERAERWRREERELASEAGRRGVVEEGRESSSGSVSGGIRAAKNGRERWLVSRRAKVELTSFLLSFFVDAAASNALPRSSKSTNSPTISIPSTSNQLPSATPGRLPPSLASYPSLHPTGPTFLSPSTSSSLFLPLSKPRPSQSKPHPIHLSSDPYLHLKPLPHRLLQLLSFSLRSRVPASLGLSTLVSQPSTSTHSTFWGFARSGVCQEAGSAGSSCYRD